jgi:hypothetical protein
VPAPTGDDAAQPELNARTIVYRLLAGEREIKIQCKDDRSAINLYNSVMRFIEVSGLAQLDDVSVRLAPERAVIRMLGRRRLG